MKRDELQEVIMDVFSEYMPKAVTVGLREDITKELISELEDRGVIELEEEEAERNEDDQDVFSQLAIDD